MELWAEVRRRVLTGQLSKRAACRLGAELIWVEVIDEGSGFNPNDVPDPTCDENLEKPCGRGILLMRNYMTHVEYNAQGNRVTMEKHRSDPTQRVAAGRCVARRRPCSDAAATLEQAANMARIGRKWPAEAVLPVLDVRTRLGSSPHAEDGIWAVVPGANPWRRVCLMTGLSGVGFVWRWAAL